MSKHTMSLPEPIAVRSPHTGHVYTAESVPIGDAVAHGWTPLYSAEQMAEEAQRELSDEEIVRIAGRYATNHPQWDDWNFDPLGLLSFARAVLAAGG